MALSFLYRLVRRVVEFLYVHRMDAAAKYVRHRNQARPRCGLDPTSDGSG
jgi:hypothetical protein